MANVTATISAGLQVNETGTPTISTGQNLVNNINRTLATSLANGTATGQIDTIYSATGNFTASTAKTFQISASGSLKDNFNNAVAMARLKVLYFANLAVTEANNSVTLGSGTNPITTIFPSTSTIVLPAGGVLLLTAPLATAYVVTATTADTLTATPGTGTPAFEIILLGCSA